MYVRFLEYIQAQNLFLSSDKLLLGVSGGVDSVVLANLIKRKGNTFAIAHCNFHLRGDESDGDAQFVSDLAQQYGVQFFKIDFNTKEHAANNGISIEMAARELRYKWFEEIRKKNGFDYILIAHHLDDIFETFILNLSRGTGIRGLSGIKQRKGKILRPLLFALRSDIDAYAKSEGLQFRYDSTNSDVQIKRNLIRNQIMPLMENLNPAFKRNFKRTIDNLQQTEDIFLEAIDNARTRIISFEDNLVRIDIAELEKLSPINTYLFEILKEFGFNYSQAEEIASLLEQGSGKKFFSAHHRLVIDRTEILITELEKEEDRQLFYIESPNCTIEQPFPIDIEESAFSEIAQLERSKRVAQLDLDKVSFPLILRKWEPGDSFVPLGMTGIKKLSDFFVDIKLSIPEKENTWVLLSEGKIAWVIGHRIDNRFKATERTKHLLKLKLGEMN